MAQTMAVNFADIEDRLDARFYITVNEVVQAFKRAGYKTKPLGFFVTDVFRGRSPEKSYYLKTGIPVLKTVHITDSFLNWGKMVYVSQAFYDANKKYHPDHLNLLITSTGVGSVGKVEIYDFPQKCTCSAKISIVKLNKKKIDPYYVFAFLRSRYGRLQLEQFARGATGQVELYPSDIKRVVIPIPSRPVAAPIVKAVKNARRKMMLAQKAVTDLRDGISSFDRALAGGSPNVS